VNLLVVGASSGIGHALVREAGTRGVAVAGAARRADLIPCPAAIRADVRDGDDCDRLVAEASAALGGLDALVYCAGRSPLAPTADLDARAWADLVATNLVGAALVIRAALPQLERVAVVSSRSARDPWPGLVPYGATKAALETLAAGWRRELDGTAVTCVVAPDTVTEFGAGWSPEQLTEYLTRWGVAGLVIDRVWTAEEVAAAIVEKFLLVADPPHEIDLTR
jgi:NAD(P)-dependent dehydrogenase (short-subunit alcohol dehydrogenase family)